MSASQVKILSLDTATEACSAALYVNGDVQQKFQLAPREHTALILNMIDELLAEAGLKVSQLDALAFGRGPGSFTGVRIATGIVQGMAFGADLPVVPISTLASIAQATFDDHGHKTILATIDARMGGVYWGRYFVDENDLVKLDGVEAVSTPDQVQVPNDQSWIGAGSGWKGHYDELMNHLEDSIGKTYPDYLPQSSTIAKLAAYEYQQGNRVDAKHALPVYLRDDVAKKAVDQSSK